MNAKRRILPGMFMLAALLASAIMFDGARGTAPVRAEAIKAFGTATLTPTRTRTPTITPTPDKMHFSMSNSNGVPPGDVLAEMTFFQGGGCYDCGPCDPNLAEAQPARELMVPITLRACWPQRDEWVYLTVYRPDGRADTHWARAQGDSLGLVYQPLYDHPPGAYWLKAAGAQTTRWFSVIYTAPGAPRLMAVPASPFEPTYGFQTASSNLVLDHFVPGEKVRLFAFRYSLEAAELSLLGWQEWTIRGDGRMPVHVDLSNLAGNETALFVAYGERSGEVHYLQVIGDNYLADPIHDRVLFCPGAKASRLSPNFMRGADLIARVARTDGTRLRIHQGPGFSSHTIALVPEGTQITLVSGPQCADRSWFWEIKWEQTRGWVAEADQSVYLVEPLFTLLQPVIKIPR